jgi:4-amino-4-deoxy-L-arabinose transferase-like glycosyltransferase
MLFGMIRRLMLVGILFLASAFRFYQLDSIPPGLFFDEAIDGNQALESWRTGHFKVFYPENTGREGLFIWLAAVPLTLFGNEPWALRSVSAVAGMLTVCGLYALANLLFGWRIAILSSALMATSFVHILLSRVAFRAILAPLCLVWALYFYYRGRQQSSMFHFAIGGFFVGLGLYTYTAFRPMLLLFALLWIWDLRERPWRKPLFIFAGAGFLLALPLGIYALEHPNEFWGRTSEVSLLAAERPLAEFRENLAKTAGMFHVSGDTNGRHNLPPAPLLPVTVGMFFLAGFAVLASHVIRTHGEPRRLALFELAWFGIALLPTILSQAAPHFLRAIQVVPIVYLIAGQGLWAIWEFLEAHVPRMRQWASVALGGVLLLITVFEGKKYFVDWGRHPQLPTIFIADYVELGRKLNALPRTQSIYIYVPDSHFLKINGISTLAQPVMFITDTFTPEQQGERNIFYVAELPKHLPPHSVVVTLK